MSLPNLKNWLSDGLPVGSCWATGHDPAWNIARATDVDCMYVPQLPLEVLAQCNNPKIIAKVGQYAAALKFISDNGLPFLWKFGSNLNGDVVATYPTAGQLKKLSNGTVKQTTIPDIFSGVQAWGDYGKALGSSPYVMAFMQMCPIPGMMLLADNHEGEQNFKLLCAQSKTGFTFLPKAQMEAVSMRAAEWVEANGLWNAPDALEHFPKLWALAQAQYKALFDGFNAGVLATWKWLTIGYSTGIHTPSLPTDAVAVVGYSPEMTLFDGCGPPCYPNDAAPYDLADLYWNQKIIAHVQAWEWHELHHEHGIRCTWIAMSEKIALLAAKAGVHDVITPEMYAAWCGYLAWLMRTPLAIPVLLYHFVGYKTKATDPFFTDATAADRDALDVDYSDLTQGDYSQAAAVACSKITDDRVIDYWRHGMTIPITCDNDRACLVAVRFDDETTLEPRVFVYGFTANNLGSVAIQIGDIKSSIDFSGKYAGQWIVKQSTGDIVALETAVAAAQAALDTAKTGGFVVTKLDM